MSSSTRITSDQVVQHGVLLDGYLPQSLKGVWGSNLELRGYTLAAGDFKSGGIVSNKLDAIYDETTQKCYVYVGVQPFPVTVPAESVVDINWSVVSFSSSYTVGNDTSSGAYYDFAQISDALKFIAKSKGANKLNNQTTFRIVIPQGRHKFDALRIRGNYFGNVQIWGTGSSSSGTIAECTPDNITDGIWCSIRFSGFADIAGIRFVWSPLVTATTNVSTVCQRWYGSGSPPWGSLPTVNFFDFLSCDMGRMSDLLMIGDETGTGVRLGAGINAACTTIHQIDAIETRNLRDSYVFYNGCVIGSGYGQIKCTQGYNYIVNHESTVHIRASAATAFATTAGVVNVGSVYIDTFRGTTTIAELGAAGGGIDRFDTLFLMDAGEIVCKVPANAFGVYNKMMESFADGNKLSTLLTTTDTNIILSNNKVIKLESGVTDQNAVSRRMGALSYTGNGGPNNTIAIPPMVAKLTIRNRVTNMSITLISNLVLLNSNGTNAAWLNTPASSLVVYTGDFNTSGVVYDVVWEK